MIEPWSTPASKGFQIEAAPGSTTPCLRSANKFLNHNNRETETPIDSSLKKRPLCYTLSNALLMSQNTPRIYLFRRKIYRMCYICRQFDLLLSIQE